MINGLHTLFYSDDSAKPRAFFRDVLGMPFMEHGEGSGWLIFKTGPSEMGVHPTSGVWEGKEWSKPMHHEISLMCDDIEATVKDIKAKGGEFEGEIQNMGFGMGITLIIPAAGTALLYQPLYDPAYNL